jgi:hypothetical protein
MDEPFVQSIDHPFLSSNLPVGKAVSLRQGSARLAPGADAPVTPLAAHPSSVRAALRVRYASTRCPFCPPPAGGRPLSYLIWPPLRYGPTTKVVPAGSCPPASTAKWPNPIFPDLHGINSRQNLPATTPLRPPGAARPATWRWWRTLRTRPVVPPSRALRCHNTIRIRPPLRSGPTLRYKRQRPDP